jgi:hypothetical protein
LIDALCSCTLFKTARNLRVANANALPRQLLPLGNGPLSEGRCRDSSGVDVKRSAFLHPRSALGSLLVGGCKLSASPAVNCPAKRRLLDALPKP